MHSARSNRLLTLTRLSSPNAIIKWNPRREDKEQWLKYAEQHGCWTSPREGKRVALFSIQHQRQWRGYEYSVRRVMRVVERTIDKKGQILLTPEIELEGWWTSLLVSDKKIVQWYADHGTSEQCHSEFKTALDGERLPSKTGFTRVSSGVPKSP